jgi:hypothetical protein
MRGVFNRWGGGGGGGSGGAGRGGPPPRRPLGFGADPRQGFSFNDERDYDTADDGREYYPPAGRGPPPARGRGGTPSSPLAAWTIITTRGLVAGSLGLYPPAVIRDSNNYNCPIRGCPALRLHRLKAAGASPRPRRSRSCNSPRGVHKSLCSHLPVKVARVRVMLTPPPALGKLTPLLRSTRALLARLNASPHS